MVIYKLCYHHHGCGLCFATQVHHIYSTLLKFLRPHLGQKEFQRQLKYTADIDAEKVTTGR